MMKQTLTTIAMCLLLVAMAPAGAAATYTRTSMSMAAFDTDGGYSGGSSTSSSWLVKNQWQTMAHGVDFTMGHESDLSSQPPEFHQLQTELASLDYTILPPTVGTDATWRMTFRPGNGWIRDVERDNALPASSWKTTTSDNTGVRVERRCVVGEYETAFASGPLQTVPLSDGQSFQWKTGQDPRFDTIQYRVSHTLGPQESGELQRSDNYEIRLNVRNGAGCEFKVSFYLHATVVYEQYDVPPAQVCKTETLTCISEYRWISSNISVTFERPYELRTQQETHWQRPLVLYLPIHHLGYPERPETTFTTLATTIQGLGSGDSIGPALVRVDNRLYAIAGKKQDNGFLAPLHDLQDPWLSSCLLVL
jgi:hypothetical protein